MELLIFNLFVTVSQLITGEMRVAVSYVSYSNQMGRARAETECLHFCFDLFSTRKAIQS